MPYRDIDFQDIPKALKEAGSTRRVIDRNDYVKVMKEMGSQRRDIDDNDISEVIIGAGTGLPPDVTPPVTNALTPADNTVGVSINIVQLVATFSSFIRIGTAGNITLKTTVGNTTIKVWNVVTNAGTGAGQVSVYAASQLAMQLSAPLTAATGYYIIWDAGVVKDLAGNNVAAQASTTFWNFTTA